MCHHWVDNACHCGCLINAHCINIGKIVPDQRLFIVCRCNVGLTLCDQQFFIICWTNVGPTYCTADGNGQQTLQQLANVGPMPVCYLKYLSYNTVLNTPYFFLKMSWLFSAKLHKWITYCTLHVFSWALLESLYIVTELQYQFINSLKYWQPWGL